MIHCPYCGSQMGDDVLACPRCKSLMVSGDDAQHQHALPRWLHPLTVMVFLIVASGALLAVDLKPWGKGKTLAPLTGDSGALPANTGDAPPAAPGQPAPAAPAPDPAADLYKQVNDYVANINDTLAQADAVAAELDNLAKHNDKDQVGAMRDKQSQLQHFTNRLRTMTPPAALAAAHIRLCNSQAVRGRAYRSLSMFIQSGDTKRLDRATSDLETAQKTKQQAMAEILAYRDKIPAPAVAPTPEPVPPPTTPPPATPPVQPQLPPPGLEPQPEAPAEGTSVTGGTSASPGSTAAPAPGDGPSRQDQLDAPLVPDDGSNPRLPRIKPR